jgi:DsbC/DsbD-like thiol-disulfide interchange protein/cytochrome c biogenesis protein CcdA
MARALLPLPFFFLFFLAPRVTAAAVGPHIQVDLVAELGSLQPGHDTSIGVRFVPERDWHVYWRNPGDSGEPPTVAWTLPPGFAVGPIAWPAPTRIPVGPLANYGFEGPTLLPVVLRVPADLENGASIELRARATWLVCNADECIPGAGSLTLALPVEPTTPRPSAEAPLFVATRAKIPVATPATWRLAAHPSDTGVVLEIHGATRPDGTPPFFFPLARDVVEHASPQAVTPLDDGFALALPRSAQSARTPTSLDGVLMLGDRAYDVRVPLGSAGLALAPLGLAFAGGLLLNLMPCVFPVLALKAFGLLGLAAEGRRRARRHGVAYALGVLVSFWLLAGTLLGVRAAGATVGWGFQLQSPIVVGALAVLFFWLALTLLGVTTIGGSVMGVGQQLTAGGGDRSAFFTGVLATIVATPCSAPFMGTALGYALVQPPAVALGVFTMLALGLAFPYVALAFVPALGRLLPRPGRWMETLKELLAFPLLATVAWLAWVASLQGGPGAVAAILCALVLVGFVAWLTGRFTGRWTRVAGAVVATGALAVVVAIGRRETDRTLAWEPYSAARVQQLVAEGRPVFLDFTAAWCVTCQVNERLVLATEAVREKMREVGVVAMRADWTSSDPDITRALQELGRDGVPLYVLYTGREADPPRILPQILTRDLVITELEELERRSRI